MKTPGLGTLCRALCLILLLAQPAAAFNYDDVRDECQRGGCSPWLKFIVDLAYARCEREMPDNIGGCVDYLLHDMKVRGRPSVEHTPDGTLIYRGHPTDR